MKQIQTVKRPITKPIDIDVRTPKGASLPW